MAEDAEFIEAIEKAGVRFIGSVVPRREQRRRQGPSEEAARRLRVSVTPGINNISALALLRKNKDQAALEKLVRQHGLALDTRAQRTLEEQAEEILHAGYAKLAELVTIEDLQNEAAIRCDEIWKKTPAGACASSTSAAAAARANASSRAPAKCARQ